MASDNGFYLILVLCLVFTGYILEAPAFFVSSCLLLFFLCCEVMSPELPFRFAGGFQGIELILPLLNV